MNSAEIRSQVAAAIAEAEQIHNNPAGDNGDLSAEQSERYASLMADAKRLKADAVKAERGEMLAQEQAELRAARPLMAGAPTVIRSRNADADRRAALAAWLMHGTRWAKNDADTLYRAADMGINLNSDYLDLRALSKGTNSAGGYAVAQGFVYELEKKLKYYCNFRDFCRVKVTPNGELYPWPTVDNTGNTAAGVVAEAPTLGTSGSDPTFGQVVLKAFPMATDIVKYSVDVDADFMSGQNDLETELADLLGEEMGRQESGMYGGSNAGSTAPEGIQHGLTVGVNLASDNLITYAKLVDTQHALDRKYRDSPNCAWLFNDATLAAIRKLATTTGEPIFNTDVSAGAPGTLLGKPYFVSNSLTSIASPGDNQVLAIFADFSKYVIRDVANSFTVVKYNELYRASRQIGIGLEKRGDARWVQPAAAITLNSYDAP